MAVETGNPFRVGAVLGRGFSILAGNILPFGAIAILITIPYILVSPLMERVSTDRPGLLVAFVVGFVSLILLLGYLTTAAISFGTFQDLNGQRARAIDCFSRGVVLIFPILGVAILMSLAVMLGIVLLIVPGLIAMTILWVAIPVAVVERPGVIASLQRSAELTRGYRWQIFGIILLLSAIETVIGLIAGEIIPGDPGTMPALIVDGIVTAFFIALGAVIATVGYHDLRAAKEGVGTADIAKVFD